jgi:hypothetical protein
MAKAEVGSGSFRYEANDSWAQLPDGGKFIDVVGIATDSQDRVHVFNRGDVPVRVFDRDGAYVYGWGEGACKRPHGIHIGPDDSLYLTDDVGHAVRKFTLEGEFIMELEAEGRPSNTGVDGFDYRTMKQPAGPFNTPTNIALAANGDIYVTDGYGNARVHRFSPEGKLLATWGEPGSGDGQFNLPHGIAIAPDGAIAVADRENSRVQWFTPEGAFIEEWTDIARPCQVFIDDQGRVYVAELGWTAGMYSGNPCTAENPRGGSVSIFDRGGKLLARWGGGKDPMSAGDFFAPHDIWVDSRGDIYVGEVTWSAGGCKGMVPADCPPLQKFSRLG